MKPAQWTTVLLLTLMVAGISFVSVYLGGSREPGSVTEQQTFGSLTFPNKVYPPEGEKPKTTEVRQRGYQDYWFANESGREVVVGLTGKGCTCSEVELTIAPANWQAEIARLVATEATPPQGTGLENLTFLASNLERESRFNELLDKEPGVVFTKENSVRVPPDAIGRVRLSWRQENQRKLNASAELWMGEPGSSLSARLEARVFIVPPLDVDKEVSMPAVNESDLKKTPQGQQVNIYCWSLTRSSFTVKATMIHERLPAESDPVEVGEPVPLTSEDVKRLESRDSLQKFSVLAGYRIPVTVRATGKDGTPMEWGHFSRLVQISTSEEDVDPVQVKVLGVVLGDIVVGVAGQGGGLINLGPFPRRRGVLGESANNTIVLQTDEEDVELELDRSRIPEYLRPTLSKPQKSATGHLSWVLRVEVPPNAAQGDFPRRDNPIYRDSSIYVKTKVGKSKESQRSIRIPVLGVANDG